tara:strand:+ start:325 stop:732 length:408 start_codon:yes stop_codon:yes gene_type:complete
MYLNYIGENTNDLIKFNFIRLQKILEISQNMFVCIILSLLLSIKIDRFMQPLDKSKSKIRIIYEIIIQLLIFCILTYYIPKIVKLIPFLFHITDDYIPSKKNESIVGISAAMAIGFRATQVNLLNKIKYIGNFYF